MSLILEALRKSEADRRRGAAPDLHAEPAPRPAAGRRGWPRWWLPVVVGTALLLAGVLAWSWRAARPAGAGMDAYREPAHDAAAGPAPRNGGTTLPSDGDGGSDGRAAAPQPPPLPAVDRLLAPPRRTAVAQVPPPATGPPVDSADAIQPGPRATVPDADAAAMPTAPAVGPAPAATPATATPHPPAAEAATDTLPTIAELPAEARSQLPAMKLSVHMWNQDPARRFVILDGDRRVEGDRIGSARIAAIDSDGVVLDLGGRLVRLPLR